MTHGIRRGLSAAVVAMAVVAAAPSAQERNTGTVAGSVRRASGPVESARVVVDSGSDSKYSASAATDRNGRFTIANAPLGAIRVKVYDAQNKIIAQGSGTLTQAGETLTLMLQAP
jgi:carboxypeptidase family protein